jgi:hypothetical protein
MYTNQNPGEGYDGLQSPHQIAQSKAADAQSAADLNAKYAAAQQSVISNLNSGNFAGAFSAAEAPGFNMKNANGGTNLLLEELQSAQGLKALDPTLKWNPQQINSYYQAAMSPGNWNANTFGANPYGKTLWGSNAPGKAASDAATNLATQGDNSAPDLARFAGAQPTTSFLSKYGADIAALAATVVTWGAASPLLVAAVGAGTAIASNAIAGHATTWGSVGKDIAGAALGAAVPGIGGMLNDATGMGTTLATGLAGAGVGAARSAINGGNVGLGAFTGGVGGALNGSGTTAQIGNMLGGGALGGALASVGTGMAVNRLGQALAGGNAIMPRAPAPAARPVAAPQVPAASPPQVSAATPATPAAPAQSAVAAAPASAQPTAAPANATTNIGSYPTSGLGYQPMTQVNPGITDYNKYGQGPQASFFQPTPGT